MKLRPGDLVSDKYRIVRTLGRGGMGSVYAVEHEMVGRTMAMKVLHTWTDERDLERFKLEARAATRIGSPHIIDVIDLGQLADGTPYMVMEYLKGETLGQRLKQRGRLAPTETAPMVLQMLEGLGAAHKTGIIHRDLKPDNVFLVQTGDGAAEQVKILDFGVALSRTGTSDNLRLTRTGVAVGTPTYMSPEQACAERELDARTDLYALGVILYQALSGRLPFDAENMQGLVAQIVMGKAMPLSALVPNADRDWIDLVTKAMARRPEDRFQSAADFQAAVSSWIHEQAHHALGSASTMMSGGAPSLVDSQYHAISTPSPDAPPFRSPKTIRLVVAMAAAGVVGVGGFAALRSAPSGAPAVAPPSPTMGSTDPRTQAAQTRPEATETLATAARDERSSKHAVVADSGVSQSKSSGRRAKRPTQAQEEKAPVSTSSDGSETHAATGGAPPSAAPGPAGAPTKAVSASDSAPKAAPGFKDGRRVGGYD